MGSPDAGDAYLDAVFISTHKLIVGPGTPGLLIARRDLFTNRVPVVPGGGTVSFVNPEEHGYLDDVEHREEGGTPEIVGSIRAGAILQLDPKPHLIGDEMTRLDCVRIEPQRGGDRALAERGNGEIILLKCVRSHGEKYPDGAGG